ncbi:hypothetical protein [Frondihabitans peucedani]|uniref:Secreted protein n=1 Tax=Frondihabitans peucedani TaxID=598626 RepID=A0ABP8DXR2_9MICO
MRYLLVLTIGVAAGFVVAHRVNETPAGREFFTGRDSRIKRFQTSVADGYRSREAELRDRS